VKDANALEAKPAPLGLARAILAHRALHCFFLQFAAAVPSQLYSSGPLLPPCRKRFEVGCCKSRLAERGTSLAQVVVLTAAVGL